MTILFDIRPRLSAALRDPVLDNASKALTPWHGGWLNWSQDVRNGMKGMPEAAGCTPAPWRCGS